MVGVFTLGPDALPPVPAGEPLWVRAVGSTTLTPFSWTTVKVTPEIQLEAGTYALLGAVCYSANAIACRLIVPGMVWRPGFLAVSGNNEYAALEKIENIKDSILATEYGRFTHLALPEVQFLASSADSSQVVYLKIVKVS